MNISTVKKMPHIIQVIEPINAIAKPSDANVAIMLAKNGPNELSRPPKKFEYAVALPLNSGSVTSRMDAFTEGPAIGIVNAVIVPNIMKNSKEIEYIVK